MIYQNKQDGFFVRIIRTLPILELDETNVIFGHMCVLCTQDYDRDCWVDVDASNAVVIYTERFNKDFSLVIDAEVISDGTEKEKES